MHLNYPEEGYYKTRITRGGAWVPVRIWHGPTPDPDFPENEMDRSPRWQAKMGDVLLPATVGHRDWDVFDCWLFCAGHPISKQEYDYLLANARWATKNAPCAPEASPEKRIDFNRAKPPDF